MAVFEYRGIHATSGKATKGVKDAESVKALRVVLRREGVLLTQAREVEDPSGPGAGRRGALRFVRKPKGSDIAVMTRQLATLVRAGIPLVDSLTAVTEQIENQALVRILSTVRESVDRKSVV